MDTFNAAGAMQAGQQAAQYGIAPQPQQPNEPEAIYQQRIAAYEQAKQQMEQQRQQQ